MGMNEIILVGKMGQKAQWYEPGPRLICYEAMPPHLEVMARPDPSRHHVHLSPTPASTTAYEGNQHLLAILIITGNSTNYEMQRNKKVRT